MLKKCLALYMLLFSIISPINTAYALEKSKEIALKLNINGAVIDYKALPITLTVNDATLMNLPMPPIVFNNYTLVPLREVFEPLGAVVAWQAETKEIFIGYENDLVLLQIDSTTANINGRLVKMEIPPKIINNKTMIPLRFVSESLGLHVGWDSTTRTASVNSYTSTPAATPTPTPTATPQPQQTPQPTRTPTPLSTPTPIFNLSSVQTTAETKDISTEPIKEANNPLTKIIKITSPMENGTNAFVIEASSPISKVDKLILPNNKIVIDFYNAEMDLNSSTLTQENNPVISAVRTGQFQNEPSKIARVVFDLKTAVNFSVWTDKDRKKVSVSFGEMEKNRVFNISPSSDQLSDYVTLSFEKTPIVNTFVLTDPERVVIDLPYTTIDRPGESNFKGTFISSLRSSMFTETAGRVVVDLARHAKYDVQTQGNNVIIKLIEPTYKNIAYDAAKNAFRISKASGAQIDLSTVVHHDDYNNLSYTLTLPWDYSSFLGFGEYIVNNDKLYSLNVQTSNGKTLISIKEKKVLAYNLSQDDNYIYISALSPKEKYPKIVIIDPGHGGGDNGASGNGIIEKNTTLEVANRVMSLIEQEGKIKAYATRRGDVAVDLFDRPVFSSPLGDIFVSIHINSHKTNFIANGLETYYYQHEDSKQKATSLYLAQTLQKNLLEALKPNDRKVKSEAYIVLKNSQIPASLVELGFLSNPAEAAKLADPAYKEKAAQAIYRSIIEVFSTYNPAR